MAQLQASGQPIATIKAVHTGPNATKAPADDAGGLEAVVCLATSARVMLTSNLWVDVGLVNGAMGAVQAICYRTGGPPDLPIAVMIRFDSYSGPTFPDGTVPITPLRRCWSSSGSQCSSPGAPQASVGGHHTQVSGSNPGQGGRRCRQERVLHWHHICGLFSCPSAARPSIHPSIPMPTPLQSVQQLSSEGKTGRRQEITVTNTIYTVITTVFPCLHLGYRTKRYIYMYMQLCVKVDTCSYQSCFLGVYM